MQVTRMDEVNIMRQMKICAPIDLERLHEDIEDSKLYRARPQMLLIRMKNGRNMQLFRNGTVQILGRISHSEAKWMVTS